MGKLLNQLRQETKPLPITKNPFEECDDIFAPPIMGWQQNNDGLRHRKNIGQASDLKSVDIPPPPANPVQIQSSGQIQNSIQIQIPVRNVSGSALAHLNNDIIARHREMFGQPKISQRCQSKKFDDETIENLCNEIERAIKAAEKIQKIN